MRRTTVCPQCGTRYQVDPALQGRRLRCPRPDCGEVFLVQLEATAGNEAAGSPGPASAPPAVQQVGRVEELLPVLPAEWLGPAESGPAPAVPSPPAPGAGAPPNPAASADSAPADISEAASSAPLASGTAPSSPAPLSESPAGGEAPAGTLPAQVYDWRLQGPPPLERPGKEEAVLLACPAAPASPPRKKRWPRLLGLGLLVLLAAGAGSLFWVREQVQESGEEERWQRAWQAYQERNYADAAHDFRELERDYPQSTRRGHYAFLAELSECLEPTLRWQGSAAEAQQNLERLEQFAQRHGAEPLWAKHQAELGQGFARLAEQLAIAAREKHDAQLLSLAERALEDLQKLPAAAGLRAGRREELEKSVQQARQAVTHWQQRQNLLARLQQLAKQPPANPVRQAETLLEQFPPDLAQDAEVQRWLRQLPDIHRQQVCYIPVTAPPPPAPPRAEEDMSLAVVRRLTGAGAAAAPAQGVVVAAVRGLLYACEAATGRIRWLRRSADLGHGLPLRLPADPLAPDRLLVWSADGQALEAVAADSGQLLWRHPLAEAAPGRPLVARGRLWLPYASGRLEELAPLTGRCRGYFLLGESLFPAAAWREGTPWCYLPAAQSCIYVLDLDQRTCAAILYTHHLRSTLRAPPLVVAGSKSPGAAPPSPQEGYLILAQAESLEGTALQVWPLPPAQPLRPGPGAVWHLPGWPSHVLWHTAEQLAVITDAGLFALYGLGQPGNADPPVFPWLQLPAPPGGAHRGERSLLAAADGQSFWLVQQGRLQCWRQGFSEQKGPQLTPVWPQPLPLGEPDYVVASPPPQPGQEPVLYLATRQPDEQRALLSAVAATSGRLLWQQQLGLSCTPPLFLLGRHVLAWDRSRRLFLFTPGKEQILSAKWARAGQLLLSVPGRAFLFLSPEKETVYVLSEEHPGPPAAYTLYQVLLSEPVAVSSTALTLPAPVVGTPALGPDGFLLPLANGVLLRQPVSGGTAVAGPNWRSAAEEEEGGTVHVVWAGGAEYLVSDGSRRLRRLLWPKGGSAEQVALAVLDEPLQTAPLVLPGTEEAAPWIACAGARSVTLLAGRELRQHRQWRLEESLTAGPVQCGRGLLCLSGQRRLVRLDAEKAEPVWSYQAAAPLVALPTQVESSLILAQVDGCLLALDPETGVPQGPSYRLRACVAPLASPVPWPDRRLFVPLDDGTILLLPLSRLRP